MNQREKPGRSGKQIFRFERPDVYRQAKDLTKIVYRHTGTFPVEERFGLTNQIRRAAISVASNIAEGQGRLSRKDQAHFTEVAYSSLMEVVCQADIATELGFLGESGHREIRDLAEILGFRLSALHTSQLNTESPSA